MDRPAPRISFPLLGTVLTWGFNFVAIKLLYEQMTPAAVGLARWILMFFAMVALCVAVGSPLKVGRADFARTLFQGFVSMGLYMVLFLEGMNRTGAAEAAIVLATAPIFTALLAVVARQEPFRLGVILWAAVAMGGVALVALGGDAANGASHPKQERLLGDLLVLVSALIWAWGAVLSKPLVGRHSPNTMLTVSMLGALPVLVPYGLLPILSVDWTGLRPLTLGMLVYMALGAGVLGFIGFYAGVRQVGAPGAMLYQYCVSPLAAVFAYLVFGTSLAALQFVGFAGVVLGVSMAMRARRIDEKAAILAAQEPGTCS